MSITKDFESRRGYDIINYAYAEDDVSQLIAHAGALEKMLKKHEFGPESRCLECYAVDGLPHDPDCQLAKLLDGAE